MESTRIPISGIDTQVNEYSPRDGSCSQIDKFRPVGRVDNPRWEIIPNPDNYTFDPDEGWTTPGSTPFEVVKMHYAFDTWYAFVFFNDNGSYETALYSCTLAGGVLTLDTQVFNNGTQFIDGSNNLLPVGVYFQDFGDNSFYVLITPGVDATTGQHQLWKVTPDSALPAVFRPELHLVQVIVNDESKTTANFDALYPSDRRINVDVKGVRSLQPISLRGNASLASIGGATGLTARTATLVNPFEGKFIEGSSYPGILKDKDKFFGIITAFKHPNGTWVKHSQPHAFKITGQTASIGTNTDYATLSFRKNPNYTDSDANYDANVGDNFNLYGHYTADEEWQMLGEVGIFMTLAKNTLEDAYLEGTYYFIGSLGDDDVLNWSENEETIAAGEVLNIDPYSHHVITSKMISSYVNNMVLIRTVTNFSLPCVDWPSQIVDGFDENPSPKINETAVDGTINVNNDCAVKVTIETDQGTFYRWNTIAIKWKPYNVTDYRIYLPNFMSYPDRDATRFDFYWYDSSSGEHELFYATSLKPHPFLNVSYSLIVTPGPVIISGVRQILFVLGTTEVLDFSTDNTEMLVEENEFKVSDLTKLFFPLEWSYQLKDKLTGAINNTNEVGSGQFGDYPLYVFGERSVYGARGGDGILISSFDLISDQYGMNGFEAYTVFKNILYFVSSHGIHALSGIQIEDIYDNVKDLSVYFINTYLYGAKSLPYPIFNKNAMDLVTNSPATLFSNLLSSAKVGVHSKTREIVFSTTGGLLIYNEKYGQWYTYTINGEGNMSNPYDFATYEQLMDVNGDLFILETPEAEEDATVLQWGSGSTSGFFSMVTNPFVINDYAIMKRLRRMILKSKFDINGAGTGSSGSNRLYALNLVLQGKRSTNTSNDAPGLDDDEWVTLMIISDNTAQNITSKYLKSNYGSFQAFRILIYGENLSAGSFVSDIVSIHQNRGRFVI